MATFKRTKQRANDAGEGEDRFDGSKENRSLF